MKKEIEVLGERVLRRAEVESKVGLKHSAIYVAMERGEFPKSFPLGSKARGWLQSEIDAWIRERAAQRKSSKKARVTGTDVERGVS
jgi:prophage regulatory protein